MDRRTACWALVVCLAGIAAAQPGAGQRAGTITGHVFDAVHAVPIEYANVVLYSLPDSAQVTGAVTDKKGAFRLAGVKSGRYYIEASFIGYGDKVVKEVEVAGTAPVELGRIDLQQKTVPVPGVEVTAERPIVSYEVDKKVVDVSRLPGAASGTAVDALRNVPSLRVDIEDNVTLRGSSNFKVLIDGKPTLLGPSEVLKQTAAVMIDKIEIITNPSAKYEPDGDAGIINIVLKRRKGRGASALVNASADPRGASGSTLLSLRRGIASMYAGGSVLGFKSDWNHRYDSRIFVVDDTFLTVDSGIGRGDRKLGDARAGLELSLGPRDKVGFSGRLGGSNGFTWGGSDVIEQHTPGDSSRHYRTDFSSRSTRSFYFVTADYEHLFDTTGHKFIATAYVVDNEAGYTSSHVDFALTGTDTTGGRRTDKPGPTRRATLDLGYTLPTGKKDKLEAGFQSRLEGTGQDYRIYQYDTTARTWDLDARSSHPYVTEQQIYSLYATYTWNWRKLGIQPGIRGEYGTRLVKVTDTDSAWPLRRWDYFPSLHASYDLGSGRQVMASYSRRIDRPDMSYLRPFEVWSDEHSADVGNPELKPSYTNSWEAGGELPLGAGYLSSEVYHRVKSDLFQWVPAMYTGDTSAVLYTAQNVGRDYSTGVELSANLMPYKWLSAYLAGDIYYYCEEGKLFGQDLSRRILTWSSSANVSVTARTNTQFALSGYFTGPTVSATGRADGWLSTDFAVKQSLLKTEKSKAANRLFGIVV
ncbi:MAG: TonB-dependent receptor [candidate division WOR-3 bacterium]|nr:TonB-dependent receptor [candidate division WOR-3 bacterium]